MDARKGYLELKGSLDGREETFRAGHCYNRQQDMSAHYLLDFNLHSIVIASLERLCVAAEVAVPGGAQRKP